MTHKSFVLIKKGDPFFPTDLTLRCKLNAAQLEKLLLFTFTEEFFFALLCFIATSRDIVGGP